ncbi:MAG: TlpA family protein disulfide reductase [Proteobacteria bacterium]|nr:TlpA family protein disulfide reductase [Pseudomonadota bacterium]MBU1711182.1 TlpA family protein disulfide reductase [Pseudomonadota bacterium]
MTYIKHISPGRRFAGVFLLFLLALFSADHAFAGKKMPPFALPSVLDGSTIDASSFSGKVLLINFFATWCPPCQREIPKLIELQNNYGGETFTVIGISTDDSTRKFVKKFINKRKINYPVIMADDTVVKDFGDFVEIPVSFLVDRKGNIVKKYLGYVPQSILEPDILELLPQAK